jgi:hypothetical protein
MVELVIYALLLVALLGHCVAATLAYRKIQRDPSLSFKQKNDRRLTALVFPLGILRSSQSNKKG